MTRVVLDHNNHSIIVYKETKKFYYGVTFHGAGSTSPVRLVKIPVDYVSKGRVLREPLRDALYKGKPYPVGRAIRAFKRVGKAHGMRPTAKAVLRDLKATT